MSLKLYRPWTELETTQQEKSHYSERTIGVFVRDEEERGGTEAQLPRTEFSSAQIEVLESVFLINSYPGIDIREEFGTETAKTG
ncbi:hypothetical protein J4Q44_G00100050 [Coregonus suidteri]|uniref:Homeobox domain-containing protein n=1 Tax=Coregonus suidteri TaxID=861788 RepID=A0AAN8LYQ1_9TELE